jgi:hypothetical protein
MCIYATVETATEWLRRGFWFVFIDALGREKDVVTLRGVLKILDSLCESCACGFLHIHTYLIHPQTPTCLQSDDW